MILEISRIIPYKKSQCEGVFLTIQMKETQTGKFFMTYIVPADKYGKPYRNYARWRKIARVGNEIFFRNLQMKTDTIISADSFPLLLTGRRREKTEPVKTDLKSLAKIGVFG